MSVYSDDRFHDGSGDYFDTPCVHPDLLGLGSRLWLCTSCYRLFEDRDDGCRYMLDVLEIRDKFNALRGAAYLNGIERDVLRERLEEALQLLGEAWHNIDWNPETNGWVAVWNEKVLAVLERDIEPFDSPEGTIEKSVMEERFIDRERSTADGPCENFLSGDPDCPHVCARCGHEEQAH